MRGETFWARMPHARFCSVECRILANQPPLEPAKLICEDCGGKFFAKMPHARFCSVRCWVASHRAIVA